MKARIGFVLFIFVFLTMSVAAPLLEQIQRFLHGTLRPFSMIALLSGRIRSLANKIRITEWKNALPKSL